MSCLLGENRDIFFPKLSEQLHLTTLLRHRRALPRRRWASALRVRQRGRGARPRRRADRRASNGRATSSPATPPARRTSRSSTPAPETLDMDRFETIGVIKNAPDLRRREAGRHFLSNHRADPRPGPPGTSRELVDLFNHMIPEFAAQGDRQVPRRPDVSHATLFSTSCFPALALLVLSPLLVPIAHRSAPDRRGRGLLSSSSASAAAASRSGSTSSPPC